MILADSSVIPAHQVAAWLLTHIDNLLDKVGLRGDETLQEIIYVALVVALSLFIGWLIRFGVLRLVQKIVRVRNSDTGRQLLRQHVLTKCSHIIPPLIILALLPFAFDTQSKLLHIGNVITLTYLLIVFGVGVNSVFDFIWIRYDERENTKNLPLKGVLNIVKGIVWIIIAIIAISIIVDKSPAMLLTGLGAFGAALMLVFKDSILGFVAGIQLSQNDMLRVGDWIVVPSTIADGIVEDVSLTAVKVRNWNNTIVTLPPYTLVSTSFQNWRGMTESGYRLISRSVYVDVDSVTTASGDFLNEISQKYPQIKLFIDNTVKAGKNNYDPGVACVNGTVETNLGVFRAYMCDYLLHHPLIGTDQQILVRIMNPDVHGWLLQIYCYTTTQWTAYEAVQSQIFEHIAAVAPSFGLRIYNSPSGEDLRTLAPSNSAASN